jgi:GT2 family glycosyltransferase
MNVSVITPVWNRMDWTMRFLHQNWQRYRMRPDIEFIIIDNGSVDNTRRILAQWQKRMGDQLITIRNDENRGFGPANNQGAEAARGDVLIFLSNDVVLRGDYMALIEETLARDSSRPLVGAQLYKHDTGWNRFNGRTIPYLAGWCLACTAPTWQTLGGFDEQYVPCDYEDIDLSMVAAKKNVPLKEVALPLEHAFGQSAQSLTGGRAAVTHHNRELFIEKWGLG